MYNAKQARQQTQNRMLPIYRAQIMSIKDALDRAIIRAVNKGMCQASVNVPSDVDPELLARLAKVLKNLGYSVKVEFVAGEIGAIYVAPKSVVTISW
jgi:ferredoxin-fold anticodon binding domain-containing protein